MTDESLRELLRGAMPPIDDDTPPGDVWPALVSRMDGPPRWSFVDLGLAAVLAVTLLIFPEWLWLLAYHL